MTVLDCQGITIFRPISKTALSLQASRKGCLQTSLINTMKRTQCSCSRKHSTETTQVRGLTISLVPWTRVSAQLHVIMIIIKIIIIIIIIIMLAYLYCAAYTRMTIYESSPLCEQRRITLNDDGQRVQLARPALPAPHYICMHRLLPTTPLITV